MPVQSACPSSTCKSRLVLLALCCLIAAPAHYPVQAGEAAADGKDPSVVVMRTVHPRIAYRGLARDEHPVQAEATTFPGRVFRGAIDGVVDSIVADEALGELGAAVPAGHATVALLERGTAPLGTTLADQASGRMPLGASATTAGAIGGATRGLGSRVGDTLAPAVGSVRPGGGP